MKLKKLTFIGFLFVLGKTCIEIDIELDGGVSKDNIDSWFATFIEQRYEFTSYINF